MTGWVLVVDDEPGILHFVTEVLREEGYRVTPYPGARLALDALRIAELVPDLIILDMRMPGMDGWQFAAELRSRSIVTPLLVMTAGSQAQQAAQDVGAVGYLGKPFDINQLVGSVASFTSASETRS